MHLPWRPCVLVVKNFSQVIEDCNVYSGRNNYLYFNPTTHPLKQHWYLLLFVFTIGCQTEKPEAWIDQSRLNEQDAAEWLTTGGNKNMQHYSPLNQINRETVKDLGLA